MKKKYIEVVLSIILIASGAYLSKVWPNVVPFFLMWFGCTLFGKGVGQVISDKAMNKDLELKRQMEIEVNDERNRMIEYKAKARGFDIMTYAFAALMFSLALMDIDIWAEILIVITYLAVEIYSVYYRMQLEKEM